MNDAGPPRRAVLAGGGLLALAACTPGGRPALRPPEDPDRRLRSEVAAGVQTLVDRYAATVSRHPSLQRPLGPLAAEHTAHLSALLGDQATASAAPSASATSTPSGTGSGAPTASGTAPSVPPVPPTPAAARGALATAERLAAELRVTQAGRAEAPELVRLVASIGACEAVHAALLGAAG